MKENFLNVDSRIKRLLNAKGLKQVDACKLAEISKNAMSNYINGNRIPDTTSLYKLSKLLDASMEWILTGEGESPKILSSITNTPTENFTTCGHTKSEQVAGPRNNNLIKLTEKEHSFINKYRQLLGNDKEEIDTILNMKFDRVNSKKGRSSTSPNGEEAATKELA